MFAGLSLQQRSAATRQSRTRTDYGTDYGNRRSGPPRAGPAPAARRCRRQLLHRRNGVLDAVQAGGHRVRQSVVRLDV